MTSRAAGPPTRIVVSVATGRTSCSSRIGVAAGQSSWTTASGAAEDLVAAAGRGQLDGGALGLGVDGLDDARDLDVGAALVGDDDRLGEAGAVLDDAAGVADPVGDDGDRRAHREHAVGDDVGQADLLGEALVPVDRVAVAATLRRTARGVARSTWTVLRRACSDRPRRRPRVEDARPSLASSDDDGRRGGADRLARRRLSSVRVVTMAWPPASRTASTWSVPTTSSPAVSGRWWTNRCSPWTTRL